MFTRNVPLFVKIKLKNIQMTKILPHRLDPDTRFIPLVIFAQGQHLAGS